MNKLFTLCLSMLAACVMSTSFAAIGNYNAEMPVGLAYQVKIGPLEQPLAESIAGLFESVQTDEANGSFTYYGGTFSTYREATIFESTIRHHGYPEAQVVAWFNRRTIPVADGQALENDQSDVDRDYINGKETIPVNDLTAMIELNNNAKFYYTVQVGVYTESAPQNGILRVEDLIIRENDKGQFVFSSGRFDTMEEAAAARAALTADGQADAFITAYANGERISTLEAKKIENEMGKLTLVSR